MVSFSIIVPTYNRPSELRQCLKSLIDQDYPKESYEIIVIDDGSIPNSKSVVDSLSSDSRKTVIKYYFQSNKGVSAARNLGISKARMRFLFCIDDDCFVSHDFLSLADKVINTYNRKKDLLIQCNLRNPDKNNIYGVFWEYLFHARVDSCIKSSGKNKVDILGCAFLASTPLLRKYKYDESLTVAREDEDLKVRMGKTIYFSDRLIVFHNMRQTFKQFVKQRYSYGIGRAMYQKKLGKNNSTKAFDFSKCISTSILISRFGIYTGACLKLISILTLVLDITGFISQRYFHSKR